MPSRRHPQVVNLEEVSTMSRGKGRFGATARRLAAQAGARAIGATWFELQPGKTSFPYHFHTGIEEGLFILSGTGELRIGDDRVAVRSGDYCAFPAGPEHAHTLTNTGTQALQYLALSSQNTTDLVGYPDSKKWLIAATPEPSRWPDGMWMRKIIRDTESVDYFEGEDTGEEG
jgi:uncharacterized cupin superfamily protein